MVLAQHLSKTVEWYTPDWVLSAVRDVLGPISLDPASCITANERVQAARYLCRADNGLLCSWKARNVFNNPPYGRGGQEEWSAKMIREYRLGNFTEGILLCNAATGTDWFYELYEYTLCLVHGRIHFVDEHGITQHNPTHDNAFVYFGERDNVFKARFSSIGHVYVRETFTM